MRHDCGSQWGLLESEKRQREEDKDDKKVAWISSDYFESLLLPQKEKERKSPNTSKNIALNP